MLPRTESDPVSPELPRGAERLVADVLLAVTLVPRGRVVSYGDIAELVGSHPRQVGRIMARHAHGVAWWRVTDVRGRLGPLREAVPHWLREGIAVDPAQSHCLFAAHHADLPAWADAFERVQPARTTSDPGRVQPARTKSE